MSAAWLLLAKGGIIIATRLEKEVGGETCRLLNDEDEPRPAPHSSERGAGS